MIGVGLGGFGGVKNGRVKVVIIEGYGYFVLMERMIEVVIYVVDFFVEDFEYWRRE